MQIGPLIKRAEYQSVSGGMVNCGLVDGQPKFTVIFCQSTGPWQACVGSVFVVVISVQGLIHSKSERFQSTCKFMGIQLVC